MTRAAVFWMTSILSSVVFAGSTEWSKAKLSALSLLIIPMDVTVGIKSKVKLYADTSVPRLAEVVI